MRFLFIAVALVLLFAVMATQVKAAYQLKLVHPRKYFGMLVQTTSAGFVQAVYVFVVIQAVPQENSVYREFLTEGAAEGKKALLFLACSDYGLCKLGKCNRCTNMVVMCVYIF